MIFGKFVFLTQTLFFCSTASTAHHTHGVVSMGVSDSQYHLFNRYT